MNPKPAYKNPALWLLVLLAAGVCLIAATNWNVGEVVMGLDNSSPYYMVPQLYGRMQGSSLFVYGGLAFLLPVMKFMTCLRLPPDFISHAYVFGNLMLGTVGMFVLSRSFLSVVLPKRLSKRVAMGAFLSALAFLTGLFTMWVISHPNLLFLAAYGSVVWLVYLLSGYGVGKKWYVTLSLIAMTALFYTTSLNLVAFFSYMLQIVLLAAIFRSIRETAPLSRVWKIPAIWAALALVMWLCTLQLITFLNGDGTIIFASLYGYLVSLADNPYMPEITRDILESERGNSVIEVLRYAVGWMELHDINGETVFQYYGVFKRNLVFVLAGLIPFGFTMISLWVRQEKWSKAKKEKPRERSMKLLYTLLFIASLLMTGPVVLIIGEIPVLSSMFRWVSSKVWPSLILPMMVLAGYGIALVPEKLATKKPKIVIPVYAISTGAVMVFFILCGMPLWGGDAFSRHVSVDVPYEYEQVGEFVEPGGRVLVLPPPQKLYFRQYDWGYYGSDFLSYVTDADIIDGANLYEHAGKYERVLDKMENCSYGWTTGIDYVLYDESVTGAADPVEGGIPGCVLDDMYVLYEMDELTLYRVR